MRTHENSKSKAWVGIVLVALGGYFLLRNLDLIPSFLPFWLFSWEMIFVIIGGAMLASGRREGLVFLGIGAFFIIPDILHIPHFHMRDWWPLILIAVGLSIFLRRRNYNQISPGKSNDEFFEDVSIFGGSEKTITSQNLKTARINSIFGGSELNLLGVKLGQKEVILDYLCIFGGNEIIVPNDWTIVNEMFVLFGGYSDKRAIVSGVKPDPEKVLRLKGLILFGGSEVRGG
ncbi:LiaF transmembrane domain-containing protein [Ekhidna sp.]|uniref:LiaF transmembrane domain-containing protein n=1 Tax=Ekhidna sp. TaxID=2608089 RepID=UPI003B504FB6